jgi:alanyl-tRNA synthetase
MASDGILPSNEGRGYVIRRLLRRAARHGRLLGIEGRFLAELSNTVIEVSKDAYPELEDKKAHIFTCINTEEENFNKTIDQGLSILSGFVDELKAAGETVLSGDNAFKLYDTYGFPLDLTVEILEEAGMTVDTEGFNKAMDIQRETARKSRKVSNYMGADATIYEQLDTELTTTFTGYDKTTDTSEIAALTADLVEDGNNVSEIVDVLSEGMNGSIITKNTPFYATMGGQIGDTGVIETAGGRFVVKDTIKVVGNKVAHLGYVEAGEIKVSDTATLIVNADRRSLICKNHSATHLLQKALKLVLGDHVEQAGSYVSEDRLRFDFTHFQAISPEDIAKVEAIVNEQIEKDLAVTTRVMSIEDAKKTGAMALFGDKYGETVRVVSMDDFSIEFCGGTHVPNTGVIGTFKIVSEMGVAAGVRRIEALTSVGALEYYKEVENELKSAAKAAKTEPSKLADRIEAMQAEIKALTSENNKLKDKLAKNSVGDALSNAIDYNGVKLLPVNVKDTDMNALRNLGDEFKSKLGKSVIILASEKDGKVNLIAMATDDAVKMGAHAGNIIKSAAGLVGGGGGGRPNMAQAGGKNPAGIQAALDKAIEEAKSQLG